MLAERLWSYEYMKALVYPGLRNIELSTESAKSGLGLG